MRTFWNKNVGCNDLYIPDKEHYFLTMYLIFIEPNFVKKSCNFNQHNHNVLNDVCYILLQTDISDKTSCITMILYNALIIYHMVNCYCQKNNVYKCMIINDRSLKSITIIT